MKYLSLLLWIILTSWPQLIHAQAAKTSIEWGRLEAAPIHYELETLTKELDHPWSLAFLPDGNMLLTERKGVLKWLSRNGKSTRTLFDFRTLKDKPVHSKKNTQAGLFDVVLHPDFDTKPYIYVSYAAQITSRKNTLRVVRFRLETDGHKVTLGAPEPIFEASPLRKRSNHYGGRIVFLEDRTWLMPIGEAYHHREKAQNLNTHFGKIIRLHDDGRIPSDNPFIDQAGVLPEIWSYGHRNPQGILLGLDGQVYAHEHGPKGGDEINIIEKGKNYGWPVITYGLDYSGARISPFQAHKAMQQSKVHFIPSIAPSGFCQYHGTIFPDWQGDLFISTLAGRHVRHIDITPDGNLGPQTELFGELNTRLRDVRCGADGFLYLLTEYKSGPQSQLIRVRPQTHPF